MPIYEYECEACGHRTEALQKVSDAPLTQCPECDRLALRKLVSAAGFRLKGSGWYETDFKSGRKRNVLDGSESPAPGKESKESKEGKKDMESKEKPAKESKEKKAPETAAKSEKKSGDKAAKAVSS